MRNHRIQLQIAAAMVAAPIAIPLVVASSAMAQAPQRTAAPDEKTVAEAYVYLNGRRRR
jgi:hypothetical protein